MRIRAGLNERSLTARAILAAAMLLLLSSSYTVYVCSVSDIKIKQADIVRKGSMGQFTYVVGELANACNDATGVQLHITLRDSAGKVVVTSDPWPAGTHNIPAHTNYGFSLGVDDELEHPPADRVEVDVTQVSKW